MLKLLPDGWPYAAMTILIGGALMYFLLKKIYV